MLFQRHMLLTLLILFEFAAVGFSFNYVLVPQTGEAKISVPSFAALPDFSLIASGGNKVSLWNKEGILLKTLPVDGAIWELRFSPGGDILAGVVFNTRGTNLVIWDKKGEKLKEFSFTLGSQYTNSLTAFSPDGTTIAAVTMSGVKLINTGTLDEVNTIKWPGAMPGAVSFTPDGKWIMVADFGKGMAIWDSAAHKMFRAVPLSGISPSSLSVHPSGKFFAIAGNKSKVDILDFNGNLLASFQGGASALFSPDGKSLAISDFGKNTGIYSVEVEKISFKLHKKIVFNAAAFSSNSAQMLALLRSGKLVRYDLKTGDERFFGSPTIDHIFEIALNPDNTLLLASSRSGDASQTRIWELGSLYWKDSLYFSPRRIIPNYTVATYQNSGDDRLSYFESPVFSPDGKMLAAHGSYNYLDTFVLISTANWSVIRKMEVPTPKYDRLGKIAFTRDGSRIIGLIDGKLLGIWRVADGKFEKTFGRTPSPELYDFSISPDGKKVVTSNWDRKIRIWDIYRDTVVCSIAVSTRSSIGPVYFSDNDSVLIYDSITRTGTRWSIRGERFETQSGDYYTLAHPVGEPHPKFIAENNGNSIKLTNTNNGQSVILISNASEWLIATPDGYFDSSAHGGALAAMVNGLSAYSVDQFAVRNNRPDLILERMGLGSVEEISYYYMLYKSRIRKLGLSEMDLTADIVPPEAKILNLKQDGKFVTAEYQIKDSKVSLKRYNFYVNNVPLFGTLGREIQGQNIAGRQKIELTQGRNKIEISAINQNGLESYRIPVFADYSGKEKGELYFLAFGISKYKDPSINLDYADKDVMDLRNVFSGMTDAYKSIHVRVLTNSKVTAESIRQSKSFLNAATVDDTVVLFIAGHGGYDKGKDPKYYYLPHEANIYDLSSTSVDFETIENLLDGILPRRKLFLMDTCDSGEMDDATFRQYVTLASSRGIKPRTARRVGKPRGPANWSPRRYLYDKNRFIYNNFSRRTGAIVLSSSRAGEMSYESQDIRNGFFTREIIKALTSKVADKNNNGLVDSNELLSYVSEAVSGDTASLQHPTIDRDNLSQQIELPISYQNE